MSNTVFFVIEIESVLSHEKELDEASLPVREAFHVLQSFQPRGIGARDLRECFLIQAYAIPDFPELAIRILETHFDDLNALRYAKIAKELGVSTDAIQAHAGRSGRGLREVGRLHG